MPGETPGIGGVSDLPVLKTKAPRAWRNLMTTLTERGPRDLSAARKARARLRRL